MSAQKNGAGPARPAPKFQTANATPAVYHVPTLAEAARALVEIDQAGELPTLGDEITLAYQDWQRAEQNRTIGERIYIDGLAKILTVDGISERAAWAAVRDAVRPSWPSVLLDTMIRFAARLPVERRVSA